jgi:hypothetical protein
MITLGDDFLDVFGSKACASTGDEKDSW